MSKRNHPVAARIEKQHGKDLVQDAQAARQENNGDDGDAQTQAEKQDTGKAQAAADTDEAATTTAAVNPGVADQHDETHPPNDAQVQGASGAAGSDVGVSSSLEDEAQLNEHEGTVIYEEEWNFCLTMAFMHTCSGYDMLTDWGNVPFVMALFITGNPEAPDDAVLMQVKLKEKIIILPNEDQRRVLLAVRLFRAYVLGWYAIERADDRARQAAAEQEAYLARTPQKLDLTDTPYELVDGPFDQTSDLAKAAIARIADA